MPSWLPIDASGVWLENQVLAETGNFGYVVVLRLGQPLSDQEKRQS